MHSSSFALCQEFVAKHLADRQALTIADVGSCDVNGTYRSLFERPGWHYTGFDIEKGPNVDVALQSPEAWELEARHLGAYDVVISGQVLEHVRRPWTWIHNVASLAREDGIVWIAAPNTWEFHEHPIDCWRVWPDGLKALFEDAGIETLECAFFGPDTVGVGRKRIR